jgi:hypothetical protein
MGTAIRVAALAKTVTEAPQGQTRPAELLRQRDGGLLAGLRRDGCGVATEPLAVGRIATDPLAPGSLHGEGSLGARLDRESLLGESIDDASQEDRLRTVSIVGSIGGSNGGTLAFGRRQAVLVVHLHLSVLPEPLNAQFAKLVSPHCPPEGARMSRAVTGRSAEATA